MTSNSLIEQYGGCVCGSVRFKSLGIPERITVCHCTWCQRRTGTAFGVETVFLKNNVQFSGDSMKAHRHYSDETNRWLDMHFCVGCGTNLGLTLEVRSDIRSVPVGIFDDLEWIASTSSEIRHVYTRSKRHWGDLSSAVETFEAYFR
ncbi:MAG: GFA family protein [Gammaproteobacteria bacterium]|nr:GFA family protein [Gammaproteobacteria bacterium]